MPVFYVKSGCLSFLDIYAWLTNLLLRVTLEYYILY